MDQNRAKLAARGRDAKWRSKRLSSPFRELSSPMRRDFSRSSGIQDHTGLDDGNFRLLRRSAKALLQIFIEPIRLFAR